MIILAIDPSGSFKHGSGTTGWSIIDSESLKIISLGSIKAKNFETREEYFNTHADLLKNREYDLIILEAFVLYESSAKTMINQELETSELIGLIKYLADIYEKEIVTQRAVEISTITKKPNILLSTINETFEQISIKTNKRKAKSYYFYERLLSSHILDSIRHTVYYTLRKRAK